MDQFPITFIDDVTTIFMGYTVKHCGCILKKMGEGQVRATRTGRKRSQKADADVGLYYKNKRYWFKVHRIVAHCFLSKTGQEWNTMEVNHKDMNTMHNHVDNLEWITPEENKAHYWSNR